MFFWKRSQHPPDSDLSALLDHELTEPRWVAITQHLEECEECAARLSHLESTKALVGALAQAQPGRSFVLGAEYERPVRAPLSSLAFVPVAAMSLFLAVLALDVSNLDLSSESSGREVQLASKAVEDSAENAAGASSAPAPPPMPAQRGAADQFGNIGLPPGATPPPVDSPRVLTAPTAPEAAAGTDSAATVPAEQRGAGADGDSLSEQEASGGRDWLRLIEAGALTIFVVSLAPIFWSRRSRGVRNQ
jgi:hypothetical protein